MSLFYSILLYFSYLSQPCTFPGETAWKIATTHRAAHPFFVSVTEIEENTKEKMLKVTCRIFTDNFEAELKKKNGSGLNLQSDAGKAKVEKLLEEYIKEHLQIYVDNKPFSLDYIGFEIDGEAFVCYFEIKNASVLKTVTVVNNLLFDLSSEQMNIVYVVVHGVRKSAKLSNPESTISFNF